jgi:uncharacterized protein YndB with AHSA1/START domain
MLDGTRETSTRGPRTWPPEGRVESLANPTRPKQRWVMSHVKLDILVEAPVEDVVAVFRDTERWSEIKTLGGMQHEMSNFTGPLDQVGSTFDVKGHIAGIPYKRTNTVAQVEPNLILIRGSGNDDMYYRFEPEGSGTRVSIEYEMSSFDKALDKVVLRGAMERGGQEFLEKMKAWAEAKVPVTA